MKKIKRTNWIFDCPIHGIEEGLFCFRAYDDKLFDGWHKVEYVLTEVKSTVDDKKKWIRIMNLTRGNNGHLP